MEQASSLTLAPETPANAKRLFVGSCLALIVTAMTFAIRGGLVTTWATEFGLSSEQVGTVNGTAFWGFTLAMLVGGFLCDIVGMRVLLVLAFVLHAAGLGLTIAATGYQSLFFGTLMVGIGNGMVEAACNPLVSSLFTTSKTKMLNRFHMFFPGGIVIGGLASFAISGLGLPWQAQIGCMFLPLAIYGFILLSERYPVTERVQLGISFGAMAKACVQPFFLGMMACMMLTAGTELGTNQWISALLANAGFSSILLLVFISGIMVLGRGLAGPLVHAINPKGILLASAIISGLGLYLLSIAQGSMLFASAAVFAIGICYFWPTMLGYVSEAMPSTGSFGLSLMGGIGMLSVSFILPIMGQRYDNQLLEQAKIIPNAEAAALAAGQDTLGAVATLPLLLVVPFVLLYFFDPNAKPKRHLAQLVNGAP